MNKTKNQNSKAKPKKEFGYKEISFIFIIYNIIIYFFYK